MDDSKEAAGARGPGAAAGGATLLRPCPKHMSATERLRKVIQELVDTEKSYVKVRPPGLIRMAFSESGMNISLNSSLFPHC